MEQKDKCYRTYIEILKRELVPAISNLTAIHQKIGIGYLSAYCGAVSAGAAAGVENTIKNIGRLGKDGMRETDKEILCIMTCSQNLVFKEVPYGQE